MQKRQARRFWQRWLVEGSDEVDDAHALQILLQSIKTLAEKGLGRSN
jgi:hypothetical protein